ncbi:uncharacterized protein FIBRA_01521 [Fibroporia radiculosa]|uniref:Uncharacterized protein n=1 Tax=Fibroporia radiculosa TaxID=599839 RepID=J4G113_9APHY|nr:uncharacterized protein FIBRA_01521 [Fibroporia radiculosa]CCL99503.1 predicted protein [Fibroporia radiculosa]
MDTPSAARPNPDRTNSGSSGKTLRAGEKAEDKTSSVKSSRFLSRYTGVLVIKRSTSEPAVYHGQLSSERKYGRFQNLREKYEQVTATHELVEKQLAIANEKVKRLQEECNLLLDAVDIAVPAQPTLRHYLAQDPIPPQYHSYQVPFPAAPSATTPQPSQPPPPSSPPVRVSRKSSTQTNGNGVKRKVGALRALPSMTMC